MGLRSGGGVDGRTVGSGAVKLLDLFCGAGGAAMGYSRAGFDVTGVDSRPQRHYPFRFIQADAMTFPLNGYDIVHASPPCQRYSISSPEPLRHPDLLPAVRERLIASRVRWWIIENVPGAPMRIDYRLCGCMFGLPHLRRQRWFETSWRPYELRPVCHHIGPSISVVGTGTTSGNRAAWGRTISIEEKRAAMGIDWMNRDELSQAIPPAYTQYIGERLRAAMIRP